MFAQDAAAGEIIPEAAAWIRLQLVERVGGETARRLLGRFGLPTHIFQASVADLSSIVSPQIARTLKASPDATAQQQIARTMQWSSLPGNHLITLADAHYPQALLTIPDPPILLYAKGRIALLQSPCIAVVGSRNATAQGVLNAEDFSTELSAAGLTIVSGLAMGIDAAAHRGGLRLQPASTIAVIGTGIDIIYPARNRDLAHRIAIEGCIISEYALGTPAIASNFPRRNRLISGLSRAVLVVEAAEQSGSLITARVAAEQGRDVFAIPGSIHSPLAKGCHQLIKQGAKLTESAQDVLDDLNMIAFPATTIASPTASTSLPTSLEGLLDALGFDPVDGDALAARTGFDAAALNVALLELELAGRVEILPGGRYRRLHIGQKS